MSLGYKRLLQILSLVLLDILVYYVALFLAVFTRVNILQFFVKEASSFGFNFSYFASIWWIPIVLVFAIQLEKLYQVRYPFWEETRIILKSATMAIAFVFITISVRNMYGSISRSVFVFIWLYLIILMPFFRFWGKRLLFKIGLWKESVLIIGAGDKAASTIKGLKNEEHLGYSVVGLLDDDPKNTGKNLTIGNKKYKIYGKIKNFEKFVNLLKIETIFIATPHISQEELTTLVNEIYKVVRRVIIVPDINGVALFNSELHYLFMEKLFLIKVNNNLNSLTNMIMKRIFDLVVSIIILPFILPVIIVLAILVKLDSKGPAFIVQKRLGKNDTLFDFIKLRSMFINSDKILNEYLEINPEAAIEWKKYKKLRDKDPRVTRFGSYLRKTSLDELAQIFNVLKGEMSLIGPRPYLPHEKAEMKNYVENILLTTPGITGLWQISGRNELSFDERVQLDIWYVQNWSLWLDIMILLKTFMVVIRKVGAY